MPSSTANPFRSPLLKANESRRRGPWRPVSFVLLMILYLLTTAFAVKNSIEEQIPNLVFLFLAIFISSANQLPGLLIALVAHWLPQRVSLPLLGAAWSIALTGTVIYARYAFDWKADSLHTSAHMHVIMFPFVHSVLGILAYLVALLLAIALSLVLWIKRRKQTARENSLLASETLVG